jgi:hypothetical protein
MLDRVKNFGWVKSLRLYFSEEEFEKHLREIAETRKPCSCYMCRNPRHGWKSEPTLQEKKFKQAAEDSLTP